MFRWSWRSLASNCRFPEFWLDGISASEVFTAVAFTLADGQALWPALRTIKELFAQSVLRSYIHVEGKVVVEIKAINAIDPVHLAITLAYLKATRLQVGLVVNFGCFVMRSRRVFRDTDGVKEERKP